MELEMTTIWMFGRIEKIWNYPKFTCLRAYTTKEEAEIQLEQHKSCLGEFVVVSSETWFPKP
jgi:hypothetical protein